MDKRNYNLDYGNVAIPRELHRRYKILAAKIDDRVKHLIEDALLIYIEDKEKVHGKTGE